MRVISFIKNICAGIGLALFTILSWASWMYNYRSWSFMLGKSTYTTNDYIIDVLVYVIPVFIVLSIMIVTVSIRKNLWIVL